MENLLKIKLLSVSDARSYAEHIHSHIADSGKNGNLIYTPCEKPQAVESIIENAEKVWLGELGGCGWSRSWGLFDGDKIVGHLDLDNRSIPACLHRVEISLGLDKCARKKGYAKKLLKEALQWARTQGFIDYLDLGVFSQNEAAIALYTKYGFLETGRTPDRFRVHGEKIDDISMTLQLK